MLNTRSRKKNSMRNMVFAMIAYAVQMICSFVVRRYFIYYLGVEHLGLNSLFTNIITILSFAELGFGSVIVFAMYKPMAEGDKEKVRQLMQFYKKCYNIIGCIVLIAGLLVLPFMGYFKAKAPDVNENINIVYLIFLFNSVVTYFFAHRRALLYTSQRNDIESKVNIITNILLPILQLIAIIAFRSYYFYIALIGFIGIVNNIIVFLITQKEYSEYVKDPLNKLSKEDKKLIKKDIFAMVFHKIGAVVVYGTDSLIIYIMLGSASLGKYSNYLLITTAVNALIGFFLSSIRGSVGNHIATESVKKNRLLFKRLNFIYMMLVSFCTICIFCLSDPFINVVLTKGVSGSLLFDKTIIILVSLNFYFNQSRFIVQIFKECDGLFYQDRLRPLVESLVNLISSVVLARFWGLAGVIVGTILSNVLVNLWVEPYVLNKYYLHFSTPKYCLELLMRTGFMVLLGAITYFTCSLVPATNILTLIVNFAICAVLPSSLLILVYFKTPEFKYCIGLLKNIFNKIFKRNVCEADEMGASGLSGEVVAVADELASINSACDDGGKEQVLETKESGLIDGTEGDERKSETDDAVKDDENHTEEVGKTERDDELSREEDVDNGNDIA